MPPPIKTHFFPLPFMVREKVAQGARRPILSPASTLCRDSRQFSGAHNGKLQPGIFWDGGEFMTNVASPTPKNRELTHLPRFKRQSFPFPLLQASVEEFLILWVSWITSITLAIFWQIGITRKHGPFSMPSGIRGLILPTGRICVQSRFCQQLFPLEPVFVRRISRFSLSALAGLCLYFQIRSREIPGFVSAAGKSWAIFSEVNSSALFSTAGRSPGFFPLQAILSCQCLP